MEHETDFRTPPDGEATLGSPRFDDTEARTASPVVPLSEVRAPRGAALSGVLGLWRGRSFRRSWPLVVLLVCAMAAGVAGSALYRHYRAAAAAAEQQPAPQAAPAETTPARAAQTDAARQRPTTRRANSRPARRDDGGDATLAGISLGDFSDGEKDDRKDERDERKERKRKDRGDKQDDDDERESRAQRRPKFSRGGAARLVEVIKHD